MQTYPQVKGTIMFGYKNTACRTLILASVITLTGSYAFAQRGGQGPGDGERPARRQADGDGQGQRGPRDGAGERGPRGPRDGERMGRRLFAGMELSDEQKEQIQAVMKQHGDERRAWFDENREALQSARQKMREAHQADDMDAVQAAGKELQALMESAPKPDATHDQVRALLNEEQQATFDERIAKLRERRGGNGPHGEPGMGPGPDGPPPPGADGPPRGRRGARLFANLDLTDDQQAQVREVMQSDKNREEKMTAVREILTDDQKAQLDENIEQMRKWREEHQGERPQRGDGPRGDGPRGDGPRGDGPRGDGPPRGGNQGGNQLDL